MIRAFEPAPLVVEIPEVSDEERAIGIAGNAEFKKNVAWWNARFEEIGARHAGQFVCVAGQELFVGDDPADVMARATAAHPHPGEGFLCFRMSTPRGPVIHACRG